MSTVRVLTAVPAHMVTSCALRRPRLAHVSLRSQTGIALASLLAGTVQRCSCSTAAAELLHRSVHSFPHAAARAGAARRRVDDDAREIAAMRDDDDLDSCMKLMYS